MPTVTRRGLFETNSSSTHSITIAEGESITDHLSVVDGVCEIHTGEFGWEYDHYTDAPSKAAYCLTYAKTGGGEACEAMLREVIAEVTGAREVRFVPDSGYYGWGYIDHQSHIGDGNAAGEAFASKAALRAFIFNRSSVLITDNDNR